MADPHPPALPEGAPKELRDFIECRTSSVAIGDGPLTWLDLGFTKEKAALSIKPGSAPGTATISIDIPGVPVINMPATVKKGALSVDSSSLPLVLVPFKKLIQPPIKQFVDDLNAWLKANGNQLGAPAFADGGVTLSKVPIAAPGQAKQPPAVVAPVPVPIPVEPPPATPDPDAGMPPMPPGGYYEPRYVTPPPLPDGEAFGPYAKKKTAGTDASDGGSTQAVSPGPVIGAGGPGGPKAPVGLGRLAVIAVIVTLLAGAGVFGFSQLNAVPANQVATNPPSASTAAKASPSTPAAASLPAVATPSARPSIAVPTARPVTAAPVATPSGKVIIGGLVFSDRPTLEKCPDGSTVTVNRYTFSVNVALPGNANPPIEAYAKLLGRKAVVVLAGPPDEGAWPSEIQNVNGRVMIIVDGRPCTKTTARSRYSNLTIEGLALTPGAPGADGAPSSFTADLPA